MCREIVAGDFRWVAVALLAAFILFSSSYACVGQDLPDLLASYLENASLEGASAEELADRCGELAGKRLSLNVMTRRQLEQCLIFNDFQIESLLEYRKEYGEVLSVTELSLVDGFGPQFAALCAEIFTLERAEALGAAPRHRVVRQEAVAQLQGKNAAEGLSWRGRYSFDWAGTVDAGLTFDSDAGETLSPCHLPDFTSGYVRWQGRGVVRSAIVGDYAVRCGQGLVLWQSFAFQAFGTPSSLSRRGNGAQPYTSATESGFFRGAAAELALGPVSLTTFVSAAPVDARIVADTAYTSIADDGYHRTEAEKAKRHSMHEYAAGAAANVRFGSWRFGLTAAGYAYDKHNARPVKEYNRLQMYDGLWGNVGADFYGSAGDFRFFGEAAFDFGGMFATLAGVIWRPVYGFEAALRGRYYPPQYIATHASAPGTLSSCSNQTGLTFALLWRPSGGWDISADADFCHCPWVRYGIPTASWSLKTLVKVVKSFDNGAAVTLQGRCNAGTGDLTRIKGRLHAALPLSASWKVSLRAELQTGGAGGYAECGWRSRDGRFDVAARFTAFSTDGWDSRLCFYERGLPRSFPMGTYSGKGTGAYLIVKYAPVKWMDLWVRGSEKSYAFLMRIFIPG